MSNDVAAPPVLSYEQLKSRAFDAITHRTDGPVTFFVALARATDLARSGLYPKVKGDCPIANALDEFFAEHGLNTDREFLSSNERC